MNYTKNKKRKVIIPGRKPFFFPLYFNEMRNTDGYENCAIWNTTKPLVRYVRHRLNSGNILL